MTLMFNRNCPTTSRRCIALVLSLMTVSMLSVPMRSQAAADPHHLQSRCTELAGRPTDDAEDVVEDLVTADLQTLDRIGSACGDMLFWFKIHAAINAGDTRAAISAWVLARSRLTLYQKAEPDPCPYDACSIYGAMDLYYGEMLQPVLEKQPRVVYEGIAAAIEFDRQHPSIQYPPDVHPQIYAEVRESLAAFLADQATRLKQ